MNYYEKYRKGIIRHITSNGRLLQDIMLDENKEAVIIDNKVVGGGDNAFLYGGILMSVFSMEAMLGISSWSFGYASKLLDYFLFAEKFSQKDRYGYFMRRKNWWREPNELSKDELCGIVLGLHFYIKACNKALRPDKAQIALDFMRRLACLLRDRGYKPYGAWVFEYPFGCVFQHYLGDGFKPRWFSKAVFYTAMWGLPLIYRGAILLKKNRNFFNVAMFLHCALMLMETKNTGWLKKSLSGFYDYFANGDGLHNAYLEAISLMAGVEDASIIRCSSVIRPEEVFTDGLPLVELKDEWKPMDNLIGECFTWEHSNTAGHQLKYWWDKASWRLGPTREQLGDGKYWVESCGLGLLFIRILIKYKLETCFPVLGNDEKYKVLPYSGAY